MSTGIDGYRWASTGVDWHRLASTVTIFQKGFSAESVGELKPWASTLMPEPTALLGPD
jgi:hypothetical protein